MGTWLMVAMGLFILQIGFVLLSEYRNPSKTTAWLLIIFLFPGLGFLVYYFVAKDHRKNRKWLRRRGKRSLHRLPLRIIKRIKVAKKAKEIRNSSLSRHRRLFGLLQSIPGSPITQANQSEIYSSGKETFEAMLKAMEEAEDHIHMQFYIFRADSIGRTFQQMMIRKAKEGVKVRFLYDGLGSYDLSSQFIRELKEAGVEVECFRPIRVSFFQKSMNYRNHRKIMVVDGRIGFLGGINVGDEYLGQDPKLGNWRDTHMKVIGDSVYFLQHTFLEDWALVTGKKLKEASHFPEHHCEGDEQIQIIASGPDAHWDTILELYFGSISAAFRRIYIVTPYFVPDRSILMALKTAALSGVEVVIILPGITDHPLVKWASRSYLEELMHAGVRFYLYQSGFIHAKILIIDDTIASVGTANLDMRSFFDNFELNAVLFNKRSIYKLVRDFQLDLAGSKEITLSSFRRRPKLEKVKEMLARMLSPLL
ncbi:cardiolipin synthase [Paenibacillus senegalensis]|uniref:cardiolipin synthase n=1 Tax=Paenibacillus senegalensis TaxID=1465766 RepID=UPI0004752877|nr:cardiolipin synthase [Paenibacillus senegalensis]